MTITSSFTALRTTANMIRRDGAEVVLARAGAPEPDGAGGYKKVAPPANRPPQRLYFGTTNNPRTAEHEDSGATALVDAVLIGMPVQRFGLDPADIAEGDTFSMNGRDYRVGWIEDDQRFQVKAMCRSVNT